MSEVARLLSCLKVKMGAWIGRTRAQKSDDAKYIVASFENRYQKLDEASLK